jgi:preprotein translocase subunit SecG
MAVWTNVFVIVHVLVALAIIGLVLLQHGKGADMGSGFGGGSSSSLFGATGSANFLSRATATLATVFFLLSLALAYLATNQPRESGSVVDRVRPAEKQERAPAQLPDSAPVPPAGAPGAEGAQKPPAGAPGKEVPQ